MKHHGAGYHAEVIPGQQQGAILRHGSLHSHAFAYYAVDFKTGTGPGGQPQTWSLIVDSGSPFTFVGANPARPYRTGQAKTALGPFQESFRSAHPGVAGQLTQDFTQLEPTLNAETYFGVADPAQSKAFNTGSPDADGVLGLAVPVYSTYFTPDARFSSYVEQIKTKSLISANVVGLSLKRPTTGDVDVGQISFGTPTEPGIVWTPRKDVLGQPVWAADMTIPGLGLTNFAVLVDSGTSLFLLSTSAHAAFVKTVKGAVIDPATGMVKMPKAIIPPALAFTVGGQVFTLSGEDQLLSEADATFNGFDTAFSWSIFASTGAEGPGSVIFGMKGMEVLKTVYFDSDNDRLGFV
ncbi:uncharacterized protein L969DRAFT_85402 [Mixia osmundae IAM 14324]|uniref:Peptidase A1 domain-containing protein n=1 Tax=Mixia osmundae (strain CBS 9802 / IAM 14324 / JCM 22182 / KY 12970) TaxID=764103 RepID=G7DYP2_MIXOS|nr:uncharacterized protein L969DRAFT_85402 [Mixia osmundae IAM 14324]KEI41601.1 hypothetical protein L969DRAFT_85402 [Mixia osmundae IAM 14324]GAA95702.1 hypothetical protein E5Q_02359 [Mixia osmundae IAM 14324]